VLAQTLKIVWQRKLDAVRCFWPIVAYVAAIVGLISGAMHLVNIYDGENLTILVGALLAFFALLFFLAAALLTPAIVKWHRAIVLNEPIGSALSKPSRQSFKYASLLLLLAIAYTVMDKVLASVWNDLLMPVVGLLMNSDSDHPLIIWSDLVLSLDSKWFSTFMSFSRPVLANVILSFVYVVLFRSLYLRLPEVALGQEYSGSRQLLTKREKWQFTLFLVLLFAAPELVQAVARYWWITGEYKIDPTSTEPFVMSSVAGLMCSLAAVTLLSVAIKTAIKRSRESDQNVRDASLARP
jgi:hypothetical protein